MIIRDLSAGPRRFVELQRVLPGISTEQLRSRLNRMVADGLLTRQRFREVPPRVDYDLTERAHELMPVLGALARWGYDWAWSAPRAGERVDVGAILRLAPGLLDVPPSTDGTVELVIEAEREDTPDSYAIITFSDGVASVSERPPAGPTDVRVTGREKAWIAALGPDGSASGLTITGNRALAEIVLSALMRGTAAARTAAAAAAAAA